jgi:arsenate reductase
MNILFLCVGNSGRSQIAEGLAKDMLPKSFDIRSAGSKPAKNVHGDAIFVMDEIGINISSHKTKSIESLDMEFVNKLDYVITLCAEEVCPVVPKSTNTLHWPNEDPDNRNYNDIQSKNAFIKTRENIFNLLKRFIILENIVNS